MSSNVRGSISPTYYASRKVPDMPSRRRSASLPADLEAGIVMLPEFEKDKPQGARLSFSKLMVGATIAGLGWLASRHRAPSDGALSSSGSSLGELPIHRPVLEGVVDAEDEPRTYPKEEYDDDPFHDFKALTCAKQALPDLDEEGIDDYESEEDFEPVAVTSPDESPYPPPPCRSQWPDHVEVLSSSSQNHFSYTPSRYSGNLRDCLNRNSTDAPGHCQAEMRSWNETGWNGSGYINGEDLLQFPASSADAMDGWCLNSWNKNEPHKQRFALLLGGIPHPDSDFDQFEKDYKKWKTMLKANYPNVKIISRSQASTDDVNAGLQKIGEMIRERGLTSDNAEVMIYYTGHGEAITSTEGFPRREGEAIGSLKLHDGMYLEDDLKDALKAELPKIPTLIVLDACQSGAFTA